MSTYNIELLRAKIEQMRGEIEHELGDFTTNVDYDNGYVELLATDGYDWINEGEVVAIARLSSRSDDARLVLDMDV